jgi:hypothetical protein
MTQQILNDGEDGGIFRGKLNDNFSELYGSLDNIPHPGFVSGLFYGPRLSLAPANSVVVADVHYAVPVHIPKSVTIQSLGIRVITSSAPAGVGNARLGLYSNSGGRPGALLTQASVSVANVTTVFNPLASNYTLDPGIYWLTSLYNSVPTVSGVSASDQLVQSLLGHSNSANLFTGTAGPSGVTGVATFAGGLPSSFGAATLRTGASVTTPIVGFQVA